MNKHHVWMWILVCVMLFGGCGASQPAQVSVVTQVPVVQPLPKKDIQYYRIDEITTTFMPDPMLPVVCFYVESQKTQSVENRAYQSSATSFSAAFTSGLSCLILTDSHLDNYIEKYTP